MSLNLEQSLREVFLRGGSDLHLSVGHRPMGRFVGQLEQLDADPVTETDMQALIDKVAGPSRRDDLQTRGGIDCRWAIDCCSFRVNIYQTIEGVAASFRVIPQEIPTMQALGIPERLNSLAMLSSGLVLVTGATGSGKSTATAAIIDYANTHRKDHIITIEDPIEFVYQNKSCLVSQREVGTHTPSFADALRMALREDPDIIVVGEMRDRETVQLALEAAETGHLVFATLHTRTAAQTVERILAIFPDSDGQQIRSMLADSLRAVLSVALLKKADRTGRVQAMEIMMATPAVRNLIREGKTYQIPNVIQTSRALGMVSMDDCLKGFYEKGVVDANEVKKFATNPALLSCSGGHS